MKKIMSVIFLCVGLFFEVQSMHKGYENHRRSSLSFDKSRSASVTAVPIMNAREIPRALEIEHFDVSPEQAVGTGRSRTNSNPSLEDSQKAHSEHRKTLLSGIVAGVGLCCYVMSFVPEIKESLCKY